MGLVNARGSGRRRSSGARGTALARCWWRRHWRGGGGGGGGEAARGGGGGGGVRVAIICGSRSSAMRASLRKARPVTGGGVAAW